MISDAYKKEIKEIYKELNVNSKGLSSKQARVNYQVYGKNILKEARKRTKLEIFFDQFKNIMVILLFIVGFLSLAHAIITDGDFLEPIVIISTSIINCIMGYLQESKAENALGKLKKYSQDYVRVKRNGKYKNINSKNLTLGDYIVLESGDKVPADCRIVKNYFCKVDESILTGESINIDKIEDVLTSDLILAERTNMIYAGSTVVSGKVEAIVVAIGNETELGKIAKSIDTEKEVLTPLEIKVKKVSKFITCVAAILVLLVLIYGLFNHYTILNIIMLCISMTVASVPESLPIAITSTLSIGVKQMAKKKTIVRNMSAIETLGSTDVICTDKTGTITKNKMEVLKIYLFNENIELNNISDYKIVCDIINNCNTAEITQGGKFIGDAVDVALKDILKINKVKMNSQKKLAELPFDSDRKMMSYVYEVDNKKYMYTKGSLESIIDRSNMYYNDSKALKINNDVINYYKKIESEMSDAALKVITIAYKEIKEDVNSINDYYKEENNLVIVGLIGLKDPVRSNIKNSIIECKNAHIKTIMLTGDNLKTAYSIANEVGICNSIEECINATELDGLTENELDKYVDKYSVFSRVNPDNKLQIVKSLQRKGKIVAMTGDGVNDAPAIKLASVGIGMGKSGTDVTKEVSDIILLDDSFNTITTAVKEGRRIYDNVISNIIYNLSSNFTEILIILFGMLTNNMIISAVHVLYIDLVADTIPSITLAFENASKDVMKRKPNGINQKIFTKNNCIFLIASVIIETFISLFIYTHFYNLGVDYAQTLALLSIIINEFVFAYNCRSLKDSIYKKGLFTNKYLNIGILGLLIVQAFVFLTPIGKIFNLVKITIPQFSFVILINIVSFILIEILKSFLKKIYEK